MDVVLPGTRCVYEIATFVKARGCENVRLIPIAGGRRLYLFVALVFLPVLCGQGRVPRVARSFVQLKKRRALHLW